MKNKLNSCLKEYKNKIGKDYDDSRYPNLETIPHRGDLLRMVANIKVADGTIRRNEIEEENREKPDADISKVMQQLDDEIAYWFPYAKP